MCNLMTWVRLLRRCLLTHTLSCSIFAGHGPTDEGLIMYHVNRTIPWLCRALLWEMKRDVGFEIKINRDVKIHVSFSCLCLSHCKYFVCQEGTRVRNPYASYTG